MDRQTSISSETDSTFSIDTQEQVRRRAFEIYEQRGGEDGHELDDWLQAEAEVVAQRSKSMVKLPLTTAEELLEIIMRGNERASAILTSNRPIGDWGKLLGDGAGFSAMLVS